MSLSPAKNSLRCSPGEYGVDSTEPEKRLKSPPEKTNLDKIVSRYYQRTLSKALFMARLKNKTLRELTSASLIMFQARRMLSVICVVGIKPV